MYLQYNSSWLLSDHFSESFIYYFRKTFRKTNISYPLCITASGSISLNLFMAPLETIELLIFWYVVAEHNIDQL